MDDNIKQLLSDIHKENRNGLSLHRRYFITGYLTALFESNVISKDEIDLWRLRLMHECPGHDDEGDRDWCAYCGNILQVADD